jgi:hypothetical protein
LGLRPPLSGIDDGAGGFAQGWFSALFGNDGEQRLYGLEKLWPLGACKGSKSYRLFFKQKNPTDFQKICWASLEKYGPKCSCG